MIEVLLYRLRLQPELHDSVIKHRSRLKWAVAHGLGNLCWDCLGVVLRYDDKFGKLPNHKSLLDFIATTDDPTLASQLGVVEPTIRDLENTVTKEVDGAISDIDVLIDFVVNEARKEWYVAILNTAKGKVFQGEPRGKKKGLTGPEGAMEY